MSIELHIIAGLGFLLHLTMRWGEYRRAIEKVSLWAYVMQDPPAWIAAVVGTVIAVMLVPDISAILAAYEVPASLTDKVMAAARLIYFLAGYAGSSLVAKLPGLILPDRAHPERR